MRKRQYNVPLSSAHRAAYTRCAGALRDSRLRLTRSCRYSIVVREGKVKPTQKHKELNKTLHFVPTLIELRACLITAKCNGLLPHESTIDGDTLLRMSQ